MASVPALDEKNNSGVNPESSVAEEEVSIMLLDNVVLTVLHRDVYTITNLLRRLTNSLF